MGLLERGVIREEGLNREGGLLEKRGLIERGVIREGGLLERSLTREMRRAYFKS